MNAIAPYVPSAPIVPSACLVPATMTEAIRLAELMASAKLVPKDLQKSTADCLMVIQQAVRWAMDPFAVAQECSVISGKLMYSGKLVAAVVNSRGNLQERLSFAYDGDGETRAITVSGKMQGESTPRTVVVALKDAKTSASVWRTQPDQQLMYHGTRVWARRHAPELVLGVWAPEEFDAPATPAAVEASPVQPVIVEPPPAHDPVTGEVGPRALPLPKAETAWRSYIAWGSQYIAAVNAAATLEDLDRWGAKNHATLKEINEKAPKIFERIGPNVEAKRAQLVEAHAAATAPPSPRGKRNKRDKKAVPTPDQPEEYLAYLTEALKACTTPAELIATWEGQFRVMLADMFPPDAAVAADVFDVCLAKLEREELAS